ncbi:MAG: hypothetical protein E6J90_32280 [Deltaproteobacteria bacterium]|nr:MAG: hypothetical protein E6J90_32280 [Deltaproteobacteria bacterium]TMQ14655.1 MAG: hypothetical protein E6J91_14865 [Deltaproteobacteria bacterium]
MVAIYVVRTGGVQFHAGLYHRDHGTPSVLHFAWDRDLRNDAPDDVVEGYNYGLIALSLDDDDAQTLCALCRQVAATHAATLRFRFVEWRPRFDLVTASISPQVVDERRGFTCATFVLAMLRSAVAEELLAVDEWPAPTPDDADHRWQKKLASMLRPPGARPEEVASVLAGIGAKRILPTDVAGGAMWAREHWPVGFAAARREGEQVAARLQ